MHGFTSYSYFLQTEPFTSTRNRLITVVKQGEVVHDINYSKIKYPYIAFPLIALL